MSDFAEVGSTCFTYDTSTSRLLQEVSKLKPPKKIEQMSAVYKLHEICVFVCDLALRCNSCSLQFALLQYQWSLTLAYCLFTQACGKSVVLVLVCTDGAVGNKTAYVIQTAGSVKFQGHSDKRMFYQTFTITNEGDKWKIVSDCFRFQEYIEGS